MRKAQTMVEMLSTYSWALLVIAVFIIFVFVLSGPPGGQPQTLAFCTIQPEFPCLDATFGLIRAANVPFVLTFTNGMQTPIYFAATNSFNVTTTGIGSKNKVTTIGTCTPRFAMPGNQIYCNANIIGSFEPSVGTKVNILFSFKYQLCSKNTQASCTGNTLSTTGYGAAAISTANTANIP